jgi:hypothetical protein
MFVGVKSCHPRECFLFYFLFFMNIIPVNVYAVESNIGSKITSLKVAFNF